MLNGLMQAYYITFQKLCGGYFLSLFNNVSRLSRLKLINDQEFVPEFQL